jgi:hypothetical protein
MAARKTLYTCAALLCLTLASPFGADNARGGAAGTVECAAVDAFGSGIAWFGVVNRYLYWQCSSSTSCLAVSLYATAPIPGTAPVVGCGFGHVVLASGEVYSWEGGSWVLVGDFSGAPVPTQQQSWGQLKAHYR